MAAPDPVTPGAPFEPSQPPVIEGFSPSICSTPESFKEKFLQKTRENPMIAAQGFTVAGILLGLAASAMKSPS
ncbi:unnamed protein product [Nyctereutes procyonoides]|uniref:(raccoon dog) hypothetical protein n=1 Tax=Nyctereutes procyonoides TaxID=34880 RepID=A0A811ZST7_NYCPR|nr:unnamed protein product [Nyctereutes procyonoides]